MSYIEGELLQKTEGVIKKFYGNNFDKINEIRIFHHPSSSTTHVEIYAHTNYMGLLIGKNGAKVHACEDLLLSAKLEWPSRFFEITILFA